MKKRQKKLTAVILALSMLVPLPGMPAGALAQSRENTAGIRGYIAESAKEGYTAAESSLEGLEETEIADGQNLAEMEPASDAAGKVPLKGAGYAASSAGEVTPFVGDSSMAGTAAVQAAGAAVIEKDGQIIGYVDEGGLDAAFADSGNADTTITLLRNVERAGSLQIRINCTLDLGENTIRITDGSVKIPFGASVCIKGGGGIISEKDDALYVEGTADLRGGVFSGHNGVWVLSNGCLKVSEGVKVIGTVFCGLQCYSGNVVLSGGTFQNAYPRDMIYSSNKTLKDLLETGYAYFYNNQIPVTDAGLNKDRFVSWDYTSVTVKICGHEGSCRYTHTEGAPTHRRDCLACGDIKPSENCSYDVTTGKCVCGAALAVTLNNAEGLAYNGTAQEPDVTVMLDGTVVDAADYTVSYTGNTNAGTNTAKAAVTGKSPYTFRKELAFSIGKAALAIKANDQTITYGENIAQGTGQVTAAGLCGSDSLGGITLTASSDQVAAENKTITPSAAQIQNASNEDVGNNYKITYETGALTINKAQGLLTVPETSFHKKYGDAEFSLNCSTNGDGRISYVSSDEGVVTVSADGMARITGAGAATVTASLAEGSNYTEGAKDENVTVTVEKAAAPAGGQETRHYTYASGSKGEVAIDVSGKFPADRGVTAYHFQAADENGILSGVSVDADGNLTFTVPGGRTEADTASITVTAAMANYEDAAYTVEVRLVEKIAVEFTLSAQPQDSVYDGKPHNGYAGLSAQTVNGSYTGAVQFWYAGAGGTPYDSGIPPVRAGSYTVTARVPEYDAEYAGSSAAVPFSIRRAAITVKAENKTAQAGSPVPELTYTVSGLAENEQLAAAPELSCSADMNAAGIYPITAGGAKAPDTDNYQEEIIYENGTLTVLDYAVHVTGVSLDKSTLSLPAGSAGRLTAAISPENATNKSVSWASGSPAVASVDGSGNITAVSAGTTVITVTAADGGYMASCTVIVIKNMGGSGGSGSGGFGGSGSTGSGTGQAVKQPFIKGSSGRKGWDAIRAEARKAATAPAGGTVAVDMNGAVSVPGSVFEGIRGKKVTISLDMGNGITWSVNGKDITAGRVKDTDFSVKTGTGAVPKELAEETAGGMAYLELSLAHEGGFGFTATLTLRLAGRDENGVGVGTTAPYTGMYANLFYYNPALRSLEFICAGKVGEDGTAGLPFIHASDYMVILSKAPMGGTGTAEKPQEPEEAEKPQEPVKQAVKSVKLSKTRYTYNGKPKKPSVTAVDTAGRKIPDSCYTVSYQNNKKAGKATATVIFKGGYGGTVKKTFTIRPAGTSIQKLTAVSGGFAVKWKKKTAQTSGYQIQYSADAGFQGGSTRSIFVKNSSRVQKLVKNLKGGKNYYVRIRTYKTVKADGKNTKVSSAWSKSRKIKTLPAASEKEASFAGSAAAFLIPEKEDGKKRAA